MISAKIGKALQFICCGNKLSNVHHFCLSFLIEMFHTVGLTGVCEEEFTAEVTFATAEEFLRSLMDVAAPIQNLFAKLTPDQRTQAEQGIISAVNDHRRPQGIVLPIAVRLVGGRKAG